MKKLLPFFCLLFLLGCNKNSNELKPIKPNPIEYKLYAMLCGDNYLRCLVQVGKSSNIDTSNIKVEIINDSLAINKNKIEAYLWFQTGKSYDPDSVKMMSQQLDTSTENDISNLFENNNIGFVITKVNPSLKSCTPFQFGHYYASGDYKSFQYKDTAKGSCKAIMAADGIFSIWLNDSKNKTQLITGKLVENTPSFCSDCKRIKNGSNDNYVMELLVNSQQNFFEATNSYLKFNLKSTNSSGAGDTLFITLNK
ncbi:MAG: hypothetical protein IPP32_12620 [Bacteroidetes bacterium]|nr:hypothetical protein [Bacteroidota bacterium]